eukprot:TRINITY_DN349_c0_g1_i5.p1 TRINITY_DN349_c0_g1~~TRINITY_DN349_c0_g1_i5.p1  ORF type:complete len:616 (-),score=78.30 TRINITY_DN349_c0_g1_i5:716-2563(-)
MKCVCPQTNTPTSPPPRTQNGACFAWGFHPGGNPPRRGGLNKIKKIKKEQKKMSRVFVVDKSRTPLMPTHSARARKLIKKGKAKIYIRFPFTIILTERLGGEKQPLEIKFDPGSKTTGMAMVLHGKKHSKLVFAANLDHKGVQIVFSMQQRKNSRRSSRNRKTRYRKPRFLNRKREEGWLPPSLKSRVDNIINGTRKLQNKAPLTHIAVEQNKFDTQQMQNAEVEGKQYQHGTLEGCESKQYLLAKWGYQCAYCDAKGVSLQVEHVVPKAKGGSDRVSNLVIACQKCNQKKGAQSIEDFLAKKPDRLAAITSQLKKPLKDAAVMNATRKIIVEQLKAFGLPLLIGTGSQTHFHRIHQGYPKDHWIDAACVGDFGSKVTMGAKVNVLTIQAKGRGSRQMCRVDKHGFPRSKPKMRQKRVFGFATGDLVKVVVKNAKLKSFGTHVGRVVVRRTGQFDLTLPGNKKLSVNHKYCKLLQRNDGYSYSNQQIQVQKSAHSKANAIAQSTSSPANHFTAQLWCHQSGLQKLIPSATIQQLADSLWLPLVKSQKYFKTRLKQILEGKPGVHSVYGFRLVRQWQEKVVAEGRNVHRQRQFIEGGPTGQPLKIFELWQNGMLLF